MKLTSLLNTAALLIVAQALAVYGRDIGSCFSDTHCHNDGHGINAKDSGVTNFVSDAHNSFACKSFLTATKIGRVCTQDGCQDCGDLNILQTGTCIVNSRRSYCA